MISAGERMTVGQCTAAQPKCTDVRGKIEMAAGMVATAVQGGQGAEYNDLLMKVLGVSDPTAVAAAIDTNGDANIDAVEATAIAPKIVDYFKKLKMLPPIGGAYAKFYEVAGITDKDREAANKDLEIKPAKTAEECGADKEIPDGKGGCTACPSGQEYDKPGVCKAKAPREGYGYVGIQGTMHTGNIFESSGSFGSGTLSKWGIHPNGSVSHGGIHVAGGYEWKIAGFGAKHNGLYVPTGLLIGTRLFQPIYDSMDQQERGTTGTFDLGLDTGLKVSIPLGNDIVSLVVSGGMVFGFTHWSLTTTSSGDVSGNLALWQFPLCVGLDFNLGKDYILRILGGVIINPRISGFTTKEVEGTGKIDATGDVVGPATFGGGTVKAELRF